MVDVHGPLVVAPMAPKGQRPYAALAHVCDGHRLDRVIEVGGCHHHFRLTSWRPRRHDTPAVRAISTARPWQRPFLPAREVAGLCETLSPAHHSIGLFEISFSDSRAIAVNVSPLHLRAQISALRHALCPRMPKHRARCYPFVCSILGPFRIRRDVIEGETAGWGMASTALACSEPFYAPHPNVLLHRQVRAKAYPQSPIQVFDGCRARPSLIEHTVLP
jgi:hypothetical protein